MLLARFSQIILLFTLTMSAVSAAERINTLEKSGLFGYKPSGVAIRGFDTVAYFTLGKPVKGSKEYSMTWMDAVWRFSSQEHLDIFRANPKNYAPQYGGYCAYGVAQDYLVKIEGDQWAVVDGKLYLNYNAKWQKKWEKDIPKYISQGDARFPSLLQMK